MKPRVAVFAGAAVAILASAWGLCEDAGGWFFGKTSERDFEALRNTMVAEQIVARGVRHEGVLRAMRTTPRHLFVPEDRVSRAYDDAPQPIGHGQTISQPFIVATMTEILQPDGSGTVLEVGTGSGYQAAVLSHLYRKVYTIEIIPELAESAKARLRDLGFSNVEVRTGDGYAGWPDKAPFDAIMVTAAAGHIPPPLISQLKTKGRMVIPVGSPSMIQHIILVEKDQKGNITTKSLLPVRFVPLTGERQ
ncbi:MAG: protein-L-isoaspartate(D-aspartate) O-methyltransferase [Syntrophales bacterium]|jgi:protein-L-isoaspartate(D-aspartate) O-methyltransferase|nr:protein-L-isoaspartate(D-aspartate) O-methyltransferase [Syntrophales bacterium]MCU0553891.1 protein-L-isoaspartate(D-aspartate) O-methyltransferase [Syntrophales bacterium]